MSRGTNETETQEKARSTGYGECYMVRGLGEERSQWLRNSGKANTFFGLAGGRIWGKGWPGANPHLRSLQLTQQEIDNPDYRGAGSLRALFGLETEHSGENSWRGCHGCPGTSARPERGWRYGQRGHWWSPSGLPWSWPRGAVSLPWAGTSAGAESNSCSGFQSTGSKRWRGCLWNPGIQTDKVKRSKPS